MLWLIHRAFERGRDVLLLRSSWTPAHRYRRTPVNDFSAPHHRGRSTLANACAGAPRPRPSDGRETTAPQAGDRTTMARTFTTKKPMGEQSNVPPVKNPATTSTPTTSLKSATPASLLRALGIVGYDAMESIIVAALATEFPLLLIGPHGTAKSKLLNWLAEALHLTHRHYNAAMINFDDLVGFPLPNTARTGVDYLPTRGAIWGAQSVFIDEISRTRLDMQNRLFPIIHEKMIQGIPLEDLRYRWAAMNPPATEDDAATDTWRYEGSQPLDIALADRFPFVVVLPAFATFSTNDQIAVIRGIPDPGPDAGNLLTRRIDATRATLPEVRTTLGECVGAYVHALLPYLTKMERPISPRRANVLHDCVLAVIAADLAAGRNDPKSAAFLAVANALPHPAYAEAIDHVALLKAHQDAWHLAGIPPADPRRIVFAEADPVKRVALALEVGLNDLDTSTLIQDAYASLPPVDRMCFAITLFPIVSTTRNLTAVTFEVLGNEWAAFENHSERRHGLSSGSRRHRQWQEVANWVSDRRRSDRMEDRCMTNIALVLFEREEEFTPQDIERSFPRFAAMFPWKGGQ